MRHAQAAVDSAFAGALEVLEQVFQLRSLRPGQEAVIRAALAGRDVLAVMPTGAGKSLTYQLPALVSPGLTVVVSPLIALMKDQVQGLQRKGVAAAMLNSSQSASEQRAVLTNLSQGKLVYLSPERLRSEATVQALRAVGVSRMVVDEAHCLSQWGHDFRPEYLSLRQARHALGSPPVSALTATATVAVQTEILEVLGMMDAERVATGFRRPNLAYRVVRVPGEAAKREAIKTMIERWRKPGLVYVTTRREAEELASLLRSWGLKAGHYHGARGQSERAATQDAFQSGQLEVIVATNAFGMGVDKADVRFVIHTRAPGTLEAYYQEAGRAGRDGKPARCVLLASPEDRNLQLHLIDQSIPTEFELKRVWAALHAARDDADEVNVSLETLAQHLELSSTKLRLSVMQLIERAGLEPLAHPSGHLRARVSARPPSFDPAALERLRQRRLDMLEEMLHFTTERDCRQRLISRYFGESDPGPRCQRCDHCDPPREPLPPWSRRFLVACAALGGLPRAAAVQRIHQVFGDWTSTELERLHDWLVEDGWVQARGPLRLTAKARALLNADN